MEPEFDITKLHSIDIPKDELENVVGDLENLRDIMLDFNIITKEQGMQLNLAAKHTADAEVNTDAAVDNIAETVKLYTVSKLFAILGGGGLGSIGFIFNPLLGIGTVVAGGGLGWLLTRDKTVNYFPRLKTDLAFCST